MTGGGEEGGGIHDTFHPRQEIKKSTAYAAPSKLRPRFQVIADQMGVEDGSNRRCLIRGRDSRMGAAEGVRGWKEPRLLDPQVGFKDARMEAAGIWDQARKTDGARREAEGARRQNRVPSWTVDAYDTNIRSSRDLQFFLEIVIFRGGCLKATACNNVYFPSGCIGGSADRNYIVDCPVSLPWEKNT
jgi:hypothetical protein